MTDNPVDEQRIADLWERQLVPAEALARAGVRVVFRGLPSDAGGPDYQDALIEVGDRTLESGDVEFHVRASDWYRHGHHRNATYNSVIVHVVWQDDMPTVRADGALVRTIALGSCPFPVPASSRVPVLLPHPCIERFRALAPGQLREAVDRAGRERFAARAEHFAAGVDGIGPHEALYRALFEALGYASNRDAFRALAEAVPFGWLCTIAPNHWAATLLDAAGLGATGPVCPPGRLGTDCWRLARIRPANHPARRLEGVARLLERMGPRPAGSVVEWVERADSPADLRRRLIVPGPSGALIGAGRADEIAASTLLPIAHAIDSGCGATEMFARYSSPPSTRWTRLMRALIASAGHSLDVTGAMRHQGLHHLYHRHCRQGHAEGCPVCGGLLQSGTV